MEEEKNFETSAASAATPRSAGSPNGGSVPESINGAKFDDSFIVINTKLFVPSTVGVVGGKESSIFSQKHPHGTSIQLGKQINKFPRKLERN